MDGQVNSMFFKYDKAVGWTPQLFSFFGREDSSTIDTPSDQKKKKY